MSPAEQRRREAAGTISNASPRGNQDPWHAGSDGGSDKRRRASRVAGGEQQSHSGNSGSSHSSSRSIATTGRLPEHLSVRRRPRHQPARVNDDGEVTPAAAGTGDLTSTLLPQTPEWLREGNLSVSDIGLETPHKLEDLEAGDSTADELVGGGLGESGSAPYWKTAAAHQAPCKHQQQQQVGTRPGPSMFACGNHMRDVCKHHCVTGKLQAASRITCARFEVAAFTIKLPARARQTLENGGSWGGRQKHFGCSAIDSPPRLQRTSSDASSSTATLSDRVGGGSGTPSGASANGCSPPTARQGIPGTSPEPRVLGSLPTAIPGKAAHRNHAVKAPPATVNGAKPAANGAAVPADEDVERNEAWR